MPDEDEGAQAQINVPDTLQGGVYANGAMVWHSPYELTLDFIAMQPADPESPNVVQCIVTARVKIPPTVIFELLKAINENMTNYEAVFGEIPRIVAKELEEDE